MTTRPRKGITRSDGMGGSASQSRRISFGDACASEDSRRTDVTGFAAALSPCPLMKFHEDGLAYTFASLLCLSFCVL